MRADKEKRNHQEGQSKSGKGSGMEDEIQKTNTARKGIREQKKIKIKKDRQDELRQVEVERTEDGLRKAHEQTKKTEEHKKTKKERKKKEEREQKLIEEAKKKEDQLKKIKEEKKEKTRRAEKN